MAQSVTNYDPARTALYGVGAAAVAAGASAGATAAFFTASTLRLPTRGMGYLAITTGAGALAATFAGRAGVTSPSTSIGADGLSFLGGALGGAVAGMVAFPTMYHQRSIAGVGVGAVTGLLLGGVGALAGSTANRMMGGDRPTPTSAPRPTLR